MCLLDEKALMKRNNGRRKMCGKGGKMRHIGKSLRRIFLLTVVEEGVQILRNKIIGIHAWIEFEISLREKCRRRVLLSVCTNVISSTSFNAPCFCAVLNRKGAFNFMTFDILRQTMSAKRENAIISLWRSFSSRNVNYCIAHFFSLNILRSALIYELN